MAEREVAPLDDAEENEILGNAIKNSETEFFNKALSGDGEDDGSDDDAEGDRSLEEMRDGLEGQVEAKGPDDKDEAKEEDEGDDEAETDGEAEGEVDAARDDKGRFAAKDDKAASGEPQGDVQVPIRVLRQRESEARERAKTAETERDAVKSEMAALNAKLDGMMAALNRPAPQPQQQPKPQEQPKEPDIFADPEGWKQWNRAEIERQNADSRQAIEARIVESTFADAHERHGDAFVRAYQTITSANPQDPAARALVARIWTSPNPGRTLMSWWQQQETLREVGSDPTKYKERIAAETRDALMKDPEFRKALLADLRADASGNANGGNGTARTTVRLPKSLSEAGGSSARERAPDTSERGHFLAAFSEE